MIAPGLLVTVSELPWIEKLASPSTTLGSVPFAWACPAAKIHVTTTMVTARIRFIAKENLPEISHMTVNIVYLSPSTLLSLFFNR